MNKEQIFDFINGNPTFFLATADGDEPRVRAMMLYKADERGVVFHTGPLKEVYQQICKNPNVQLCFYNQQQNKVKNVKGTLDFKYRRSNKPMFCEFR